MVVFLSASTFFCSSTSRPSPPPLSHTPPHPPPPSTTNQSRLGAPAGPRDNAREAVRATESQGHRRREANAPVAEDGGGGDRQRKRQRRRGRCFLFVFVGVFLLLVSFHLRPQTQFGRDRALGRQRWPSHAAAGELTERKRIGRKGEIDDDAVEQTSAACFLFLFSPTRPSPFLLLPPPSFLSISSSFSLFLFTTTNRTRSTTRSTSRTSPSRSSASCARSSAATSSTLSRRREGTSALPWA